MLQQLDGSFLFSMDFDVGSRGLCPYKPSADRILELAVLLLNKAIETEILFFKSCLHNQMQSDQSEPVLYDQNLKSYKNTTFSTHILTR